jgi:predicted transcriptional regulator YdeE
MGRVRTDGALKGDFPMQKRIIYKDTFSVVGKMGQGPADDPKSWILPLWGEATAHFNEIAQVIRKDGNGAPAGVWGAMNDIDEQNRRWGDIGKYMAGCETDTSAVPPEGWAKWDVPAQTYLVADCTMDSYGEIFGKITNDESVTIVGTVHERYPEPGNPKVLELYFPIAAEMLFCQSCALPMTKPEDFGTEAGGTTSLDYCAYCRKDGVFTTPDTMEETIEACIQPCIDAGVYKDAESARASMRSFFPKLKRWAK